jgi:membrane fusion protein (multidrug efflux system)
MIRSVAVFSIFTLLLLIGCGPSGDRPHGEDHGEDAGHGHGNTADGMEPWAVTAWGEHVEIFAECEPLVAGQEAVSHTHVTLHSDFSPMTEGTVTGILRDSAGNEQRFAVDRPLRDGIYNVLFAPTGEGEYALSFLVESAGVTEEIASGRVRVGSADQPGGLFEEPHSDRPVPGNGTPASFLKEQQWKTAFATAWISEGLVHRRVSGPGHVIPAAGGEIVVTASVDGVIHSATWPYPGFETVAGRNLFSIMPQISSDRSLAGLKAEVRGLESELSVSTARQDRLEELIQVEAVSRRELEEARGRVTALEAELEAALNDLEAVEALRLGRRGGGQIGIPSPLTGRVASVAVSPGQFVAAGDQLVRVVMDRPLWIEVALSPTVVRQLRESPAGVQVRRGAEEQPLVIEAPFVKLKVAAPEIDPRTGTVSVILEVDVSTDDLRLGGRVDVDILLAEELRGTVIPSSALVDDGGVPVVYTQSSGEEFLRRPVSVLTNEGDNLLVEGVAPGERLVVIGGNTIRRAGMLSSGAPAGHVH